MGGRGNRGGAMRAEPLVRFGEPLLERHDGPPAEQSLRLFNIHERLLLFARPRWGELERKRGASASLQQFREPHDRGGNAGADIETALVEPADGRKRLLRGGE